MDDVRRLRVGEDATRVSLDDLAREGARRMIAAALKAEADEYVASFVDELDEHGKRLVVRNGHARERRVTIGSGTVAIRAPRVNDKRVDEETGERKRFSSEILPALARARPGSLSPRTTSDRPWRRRVRARFSSGTSARPSARQATSARDHPACARAWRTARPLLVWPA